MESPSDTDHSSSHLPSGIEKHGESPQDSDTDLRPSDEEGNGNEYPSGLRLAVIVTALVLTIFLVSRGHGTFDLSRN